MTSVMGRCNKRDNRELYRCVEKIMPASSSDVVPRGTALPQAAWRQNFHCLGLGLDPWCLGLGLGLDYSASVLLLPRGTNPREADFTSATKSIKVTYEQNRQQYR